MSRSPIPDPMPDPAPDYAAMRLRIWIRRITGVILLAALLVIVIRGIYVAWQVQQAGS